MLELKVQATGPTQPGTARQSDMHSCLTRGEARRLGRPGGKRRLPGLGGWDLAPGFGLPTPNHSHSGFLCTNAPQGGGILCQPGHCGTPLPSAPPGNGRSEVKLICLQTVTGGWMPTRPSSGESRFMFFWNYSSFHCIESLKKNDLTNLIVD